MRPHGSAKTGRQSFIKTKKSVLKNIRNSNETPKSTVHKLSTDMGGVESMSSPSDVPRDRKQVYNQRQFSGNSATKKWRQTGPPKIPDFNKLSTMMFAESFIKNVNFSVKTDQYNRIASFPNTFAATNTTLNWLRTYCKGREPKSLAGIDMTYPNAPFYCTVVTMENPIFVYKGNEQKHPTTVTAVMTSVTRDESDYEYLATCCKKNGIESLTYVCDRECALENGMEKVYPVDDGNIHLTCFNHLDCSMKDELKAAHVSDTESSRIRHEILGCEHQGRRVIGLVDCESEDEFEQRYIELELTWPASFSEWMRKTQGRSRSAKDCLKKSMLKSVRTSAD